MFGGSVSGWAAPLERSILLGKHCGNYVRELHVGVCRASGINNFACKALRMCSGDPVRDAAPREPMILLAKASTKIACNGGFCLGDIQRWKGEKQIFVVKF